MRELQETARDAGHERPLLVAVDQEGGRVARLREPVDRLAGRARGRPDRAARRRRGRWARRSPTELVACGIRVDFAPCVDVDTNPKNPVIGDRSLRRRPGPRRPARGGDGRRACRTAASPPAPSTSRATATRRSTRTSTCPSSTTRARRLEDVELRPFRKAIEAGVAMVMSRARARARDRRRAARHALAEGRDGPAAAGARLRRRRRRPTTST